MACAIRHKNSFYYFLVPVILALVLLSSTVVSGSFCQTRCTGGSRKSELCFYCRRNPAGKRSGSEASTRQEDGTLHERENSLDFGSAFDNSACVLDSLAAQLPAVWQDRLVDVIRSALQEDDSWY
ncbi:uncharacterized protein LOC105446332 [Strongylocentrotus purpuratus]|uniref:Uncharacterized protein n=1 Tax=Strongylocentrotus purpuratus TaxID=7668 RepID=A0A7M7LTX1_STRPU|nr:uncharacterized protein LOC105446332 [Strongylocentrotus purpuratus]|eukprot:XP_011681279.1 PREDICTED: uncharacterized protein LOC105446332 [Strongylocentrotus purpuratus]